MRAPPAAADGTSEEIAARPRPEGMGERSRQRVGRAAATVAPCRPGRASSPSPRPRLRVPRPSSWGSPRSRPRRPRASPPGPTPRPGAPPLTLELGVRADPEAVALRRAARLYADGRRAAARPRVRALRLARGAGRRRRSPPGRTGPSTGSTGSPGSTPRRPSSSSTSASRSSGRGWPGRRTPGGRRPRSEPDTPYAVAAGNLLHPDFARGLPLFVPTVPAPRGSRRPHAGRPARPAPARRRDGRGREAPLRRRAAAARAAALRRARVRRRGKGGPGQRRGAGRRRGRALRQGATRRGVLAPRPADAPVPAGATVRFHLGLLLLWAGEVKEAKTQLARRHPGRAGLAPRPRGGALPRRAPRRQGV